MQKHDRRLGTLERRAAALVQPPDWHERQAAWWWQTTLELVSEQLLIVDAALAYPPPRWTVDEKAALRWLDNCGLWPCLLFHVADAPTRDLYALADGRFDVLAGELRSQVLGPGWPVPALALVTPARVREG